MNGILERLQRKRTLLWEVKELSPIARVQGERWQDRKAKPQKTLSGDGPREWNLSLGKDLEERKKRKRSQSCGKFPEKAEG
jgi:hypothetical protein